MRPNGRANQLYLKNLRVPALFSGLNCGGKKIPADSYAALIDKAGISVEQSRKFTQWLLDDGVDVAIVQKLNERIAAGEVAAVEKYLGIWRQGDELGLPAETLHTLSKDVLLGGGDELLEALAGRPGLVRAWETAVQHGDDIRLDVDFLTKLGNHFDEFPDLKSDLSDLDVFNAYKKIADDVEQSYEILDDVDGNLALLIAQKTSDSKAPDFWKWIHIGKKFEADYLLPKLRNRGSPEYLQLKNAASQKLGVDLDEFDMYSQVQLKYNDSDYFVADQVYVKWAINPVTGLDEVQDIVVVENKLRSTTRLTTSQNAGRAASSLEVRSNNLEPQSAITGKLLPKGETINSNNNWLKVYDSDSGDVITGIDKL